MSTVTSITAYRAGAAYTGQIIGFNSGQAYERVYGVTIGNTGATQLVITLTYTSRGGGEQAAIVNSTPDCYTTTYTNPGTVGVNDATSKTVTFTIDGQWIPGQTVYVHIFPYSTGGNVYSLNADYNTSVLAVEDVGVYGGLVRVNTGAGFVMCIPYVRTGGSWKQCLAYVRNGSWKMGV